MSKESQSDQERRAVSDIPAGANERSEPRTVSYGRSPGGRGGGGGGGLRIYKPKQGYHTRIWTAVGGSVLIIWGGLALYEQLRSMLDQNAAYYNPVSYGVSALFVVGMGVVLYWLVGLNRRTNDFFIATEGEMKKVSWPTRPEVIRSTKVVIVTMLLMGMILFMADLLFMGFFSLIGVLKGFPGYKAFLGFGS